MYTLVISGIYYREKVLEGLYPASIIGFAIMLIPLLLFFRSKKAGTHILKLFIYTLFPLCFVSYILGAMCPPYGQHVFIFSLSISAIISITFLAREIGLKSAGSMYLLTGVLLLMSSRVPFDVKSAYDGTMKTKKEIFGTEQHSK